MEKEKPERKLRQNETRSDALSVPHADRYSQWTPMRWLKDLREHPNQLCVLIAITSFASDKPETLGQAFPKIETLAELTGIREDRVSEAATALVKAGYITRELRPRASNLFTVLGYRSSVSINGPMGTAQRGLGVPMSGVLPSRSVGAVSTNEVTNEVNDVAFSKDEEAKNTVDALIARGIAKSVAQSAVAKWPGVATSWLEADWQNLKGARNPEAIVTQALKDGTRASIAADDPKAAARGESFKYCRGCGTVHGGPRCLRKFRADMSECERCLSQYDPCNCCEHGKNVSKADCLRLHDSSTSTGSLPKLCDLESGAA